jgi:hypothetical protein
MTNDSAGRIGELVGGDKVRLQFSYNENSKLVEIRQFKPDGSFDSITVTYTESGEIKKVDSTVTPGFISNLPLSLLISTEAKISRHR